MKTTHFAAKAKAATAIFKTITGMAVFGFVLSSFVAGLSSPAHAIKLYAKQVSRPCSACHSKNGLIDGTMFPLTQTGQYYKDNNKLPTSNTPPSAPPGYTPPTPPGYTPPIPPGYTPPIPPGYTPPIPPGYTPPTPPGYTPPTPPGYTPPTPPGYTPPTPPGYTPPTPPGYTPPYTPPGGGYGNLDGVYFGSRGYTDPGRPSPYRSCKNRYDISANIRNGQVTFYSDNRNWTGRINARGEIDLDRSGVQPPPIDPITIRGRLDNAQMYSGYCGGGYFRITRQ